MKSKFNTEFIYQLLNKENIEAGLYVIATPLGNLSDITIRSLNILSTSSIVYCEDTRVSKKLTSKFGINCKFKPFHKYNFKKVLPEIIYKLQNGEIISLISDAGTPLISDPGFELVRECRENNIEVYSLPGPSAVIASLVASGLPTNNFTFLGFFPRTNKEIKKFLKKTSESLETIIFFESPKRLLKTIKLISNELNNRKIAIVRELTKKNEEIIYGDCSMVIDKLNNHKKIKGEVTIVVSPSNEKTIKTITDKELLSLIKKRIKYNYSIQDLSNELSKQLGIPRRRIYQMALKLKN